jgi:hypothetical protein
MTNPEVINLFTEEDPDVEVVYDEVRTWKDLIHTNLMFLEGRMFNTFYYLAPLSHETILDKDFHNNLVELTKYNIFTHDSQPYVKTDELKQISYLDFCCQPKIGILLIKSLLQDDRVYFSVTNYKKKKHIDNFKKNKLVLTWNKNCKQNMNSWKRTDYIENGIINNNYNIANCCSRKRIKRMLNNSFHFFVCGTNFGIENSIPEIIKEYLSKII